MIQLLLVVITSIGEIVHMLFPTSQGMPDLAVSDVIIYFDPYNTRRLVGASNEACPRTFDLLDYLFGDVSFFLARSNGVPLTKLAYCLVQKEVTVVSSDMKTSPTDDVVGVW